MGSTQSTWGLCERVVKMVRVLNVQKKMSYEAYEGVTVSINARVVEVTGPRGNLKRDFRHVSMDLIHDVEDKSVICEVWYANKKAVACTNTVLSHITNMIIGVTKGYKYTMKFVYAHFPINAHLADDKTYIELRNFLGEKYTRVVHMRKGVEIMRTANKDEIMLTGNDIQAVSESAALVHQSVLVKHKDIRKFLDGIYVNGKSTVVVDEE